MSNVAEAMTPDAIAARIDAINSLIEAEERAARDLALPAAAGSDEAVAAYAEAVQKINALHADKTLLAAAAAVAASQASSRSAAEAEAARAAAMARAKDLAARLITMADRADAVGLEFASIVQTLPEVEATLWAALREAGEDVSDGTIGRRGLANYAVSTVTQAHLPLRPRGCAEVARVAWSFLLDEDI